MIAGIRLYEYPHVCFHLFNKLLYIIDIYQYKNRNELFETCLPAVHPQYDFIGSLKIMYNN